MSNPVVHFEIIGKKASKIRRYYAELFGWQFDTNSPVAKEVSEAGNYGSVDRNTTPDRVGIPGGIGGGPSYASHAIFYVHFAWAGGLMADGSRGAFYARLRTIALRSGRV